MTEYTHLSKDLVIEDDILDCHRGECFGRIKIGNPKTGEAYGYVDYSIWSDIFHGKMIEVFDGHKQKGYATKMLNYIKKQYKEYKIDTGMLTDDGAKFMKKRNR
jgi:hypothetical protein